MSIAQSLPGVQKTDIMEGLEKGSLFSDALQTQWRHQLSHYKIVTFYEGIGHVRQILYDTGFGKTNTDSKQIVPQSSAMIGLPGNHENQLKLHAEHSDMCRFNPTSPSDKKNYDLVEGNILELCENASQIGEKSHSSIHSSRHISADAVGDAESSDASSAAAPSNLEVSTSQSRDDEDLERRLYDLRGATRR